jgi:hypothetical protein
VTPGCAVTVDLRLYVEEGSSTTGALTRCASSPPSRWSFPLLIFFSKFLNFLLDLAFLVY